MAQALTDRDVHKLQRVLLDLLVRSESDDCLLCDSGGYVLAMEGANSRDPYLVSALGAGVFGASRELARLLGEDEFSAVLHQGERKSIFIRAVDSVTLLVLIFSRAANVGLVKLYAGPAADEIRHILEEVNRRGVTLPSEEQRPFVLKQQGQLFNVQQ
jgi:predicted regulator of Ras-like GTPase activity (Roadblock/LC7/MglB family)